MAIQIEEIKDRLRVARFSIQELAMDQTVEDAEDAVQASRDLFAAVQQLMRSTQRSRGAVDVTQNHQSSHLFVNLWTDRWQHLDSARYRTRHGIATGTRVSHLSLPLTNAGGFQRKTPRG